MLIFCPNRCIVWPLSVPPKIKPLDQDNDPLFMDEFFSIYCTAIHGDHPIKFKWLFKNQTLIGTEKTRIEYTKRSSTLSIEAVSGADAGNYTCVATNHAGSTNSITELIVKG